VKTYSVGQFDGVIESKNQYGSETATTSYSLTCRFPKAKFDSFKDKVVAVLKGHSYTFNFSTNLDSSTSDAEFMRYQAHQTALENLMVTAASVEEVMLVVPTWQSVLSNLQYSPPINRKGSISINLNQIYVP
jgi:hypothetical protein